MVLSVYRSIMRCPRYAHDLEKTQKQYFLSQGGLYCHGNELDFPQCIRLSSLLYQRGNPLLYQCII